MMPTNGRKLRIYLAGGFRSGWQDTVMDILGHDNYEYFDPRQGKLASPEMYTAIDGVQIEWADILFVYLEGTNPAGWDAIFEIGYATAIGKFVIFVDEKYPNDPLFARYCTMARESSDIYSHDFEATMTLMTKMRPT